MKNYTTIIFDLDDTLIDDTVSCSYAYQKILDNFSFHHEKYPFFRWKKFDEAYWHSFEQGKMIIPDWIPSNGEERTTYLRANRFFKFFEEEKITYQQAVEMNKIYLANLSATIIPMPNGKELLKSLETDMTIVIATNGSRKIAWEKLEKAQLDAYIDYLISYEDCEYSKPHPNFFLYLNSVVPASRDEMILVGDSLTTDILGGNNFGIDTVWYHSDRKKTNTTDIHPTYEISNLNEIPSILSKVKQKVKN